ncbi:nitroreductase [Xanthomonas citri pv. anacardii]|uniref:nitroreductase n=1 Tax=Xanthomonas citri TaxID=346 RepID=UPI000CCC2B99|nr:nitroreductase [Xanthomonas citri]MCT8358604.1 nitroreductase [Xanthomonas citri pv. anacardii]MCT8362649.1 nitroreductase [Xanthomonas citri pv. anacardii]MCT8366679.1 nitroreductase [Xanthomonas citri pv. anacardii]MCT8370708.1 nitroreductase [Xanthomonas citri pv. anacardii]MCT8374729.1 nitroreductase [Xanthomonas citri pv. anacardii]
MPISFQELVAARRSVRDYLPTPLSQEDIAGVLRDAQMAPSNCNTQPWIVHMVSGWKRRELSAALQSDFSEGRSSPDFPFDVSNFHGKYEKRRQDQGKLYYISMGIERDDQEGRIKAISRNLKFFDAPHVAFVFMPPICGNEVHAAADIGMFAQNFLLSLFSRGYAGIAQGILGEYAGTVKRELGVAVDYRLMFGISFGHEDKQGLSAAVRVGRAPSNEVAFFHG